MSNIFLSKKFRDFMDDRQLAIMPTEIIEQKPLIPRADVGKLMEIPRVSVARSCSSLALEQILQSVN
jgi:hypothetical protein